jgi:hypothetical protein
MVKRAVVVGVNDYSVQGFSSLQYCVRDAQAMYYLLVDAFIFDPSQVWIYTDRNATSSNIRQAISYMLSVSEPGDVACFYYSGHGGLHPTSDTTWYQTIIPYSGRFITDWDLFFAAEALQQSLVNFTVVLDSCHSGGMHEESEHPESIRAVRMAQEMIERIVRFMRTLIPFGTTTPNTAAYDNNAQNVRDAGDGLVCLEEDPNRQFIELAKSTLVSACKWDEYAQEDPGNTIGHGILTQAFLDLVNQSNFLIDHHGLHTQLLTRVGELATRLSISSQTPQIRGQANRMEEDFLLGWRDSR